jgi:myosin protein heavy chain
MVEEEEKESVMTDAKAKEQHIEQLVRSIDLLQQGLATEEESKRRMLLRYVHVAKDNAILQSLNAPSSGPASNVHSGVLQLTDSNITDEEVHALSALLRSDLTIEELHLRNNVITDDGARALGIFMV